MTPPVASPVTLPVTLPDLPLHTDRLVLRRLTDDDVEALLAYCSLDEVTRYLPFPTLDREGVVQRLARVNGYMDADHAPEEDHALTLGVEHDGVLVGDVMLRLKGGTGETRSVAEVGYVFSPAHAGHGYATEAVRALVELAFGHFGCHRVFANLDPRNTASARLCERLGMRHEAHLRRDWYGKGEWSDTAIYGLLADDPRPPVG